MQIVDKKYWEENSIVEENKGWNFESEDYFTHENGNLHGQIVTFAKHMKLFEDFGDDESEWNKHDYKSKIFDLKNKVIVDMCGGPSSLLLRCKNFKRAMIIDPGDFPDFIVNRYKENNIEILKIPAEEFDYKILEEYKENHHIETWFYNALAHCFQPYIILKNAMENSNIIRMIEGCNMGINIQHPQNLTQEEFEEILGQRGIMVEPNDPSPSPRGLHFVGVFHYNLDR